MTDSPTIFALATPPGRSGVAVVRVSGPRASEALHRIAGIVPAPRLATFRTLRDPASAQTLDKALILFFPGPASYTGEDTAEFHLHGGRAVIEGVLSALTALPGHRLAEPGEFTRRAFEHGKLDLTEAEAVADLIDAETFLQREQALQQMGGALARKYQDWTDRLAHLLAHAEADIDFPDDDLPDGIAAALRPRLEAIRAEIAGHLDDNHRGERLRDGIRIAVLGAPNAGKSSLVNVLAGRDVAIVAPVPGTTRDIVEAHLRLGGYPVIVADTAGLRTLDHDDVHAMIEGEGIRRAQHAAESADIRLLIFDATLLPHLDRQTQDMINGDAVVVYNKVDSPMATPVDGIAVSAVTGSGLDVLTEHLTAMISKRFGHDRHDTALTRRRHRDALEDAGEAIAHGLAVSPPELVAENLRIAVRALGRITGRVDVEDLLDRIFRDFCIGK